MGIEANHEKIKGLLEIKTPRTIKDVQRLTGRVATLNRFASRAMHKCLSFFKVLRKAFEWDEECDKTFRNLKSYLGSLLLLSRPISGEKLYVYLAVLESTISAAIVREDDGVQRPVYFNSKAL